MIGVVVPAHNEETLLGACVAALRCASHHPGLHGEPVVVVVVLDACRDGSAAAARRHWSGNGLYLERIDVRNVGLARAHGADMAMALGAQWLAFTDADTVVAPDWLAQQRALGTDAVCGSVAVEDWSCHGEHAAYLQRQFAETYQDADGHRHIHGANLGVSAAAYRAAGGFAALDCSEDVALVAALQKSGASIAWSAAPRVVTSARGDPRCRGGFGDAVLRARALRPVSSPRSGIETPELAART